MPSFDKCLVSVIVPIYGVEKYLSKCIESIISQTYKNLEIILVDDGSRDNSPQIIDEFAKRDERIVVIHKKNGGLVSARKVGVKIARGDFIQFVDGDDWIDSNMINIMVSNLLKAKADIAMCSYFEVRDKILEHRFMVSSGIYKDIFLIELKKSALFKTYEPHYTFGIEPVVWNKMFSASILKQIELQIPDSITYGEDTACTFPALVNANSICVIDETLYYYRIHDDSMSKAYSSRQTIDTIVLIDYLKETIGETIFKNQLPYYHITILIANYNNESRNPVLLRAIGNYKKLHKFCKYTNLKKLFCVIDTKKLNTNTKIMMYAIRYHVDILLYILLCLRNR